jgi:transcriptional regulator of acetoin/glycerol metabolism
MSHPHGSESGAAASRLLDIDRRSLYRRLKPSTALAGT